MFDEFSAKFESVFRVFFIVWVCGWGVVNLLTLLRNYADINVDGVSGTDLGVWWVSTFGNVVSLACGIFLFFLMTSVPSRIAKAKKISNLGLMTALAAVYYLLITVADIFAQAVFNAGDFTQEFARLTAWLLPSIIILVVHVLYFSNLRAYNRELESAKLPNNPTAA